LAGSSSEEEEEETEGETEEGEETPPDEAAEGARGVGIGIAVNVARTTTAAMIESGVQAKAAGILLSAKTPADGAHAFSSEAISGAGAKKVGFAGAFGLNLVKNELAADVAGGAQLDAGTGNLSLDVAGTATNTAKATASVTTDEAKRGVGTPFAINVARNTVRSEVADDALVRRQGTIDEAGAADISLKATSTQTATTEAKGGAGAEGAAGAKAATPVFSIASIHNTTIVRLGGDHLATNRATGNATIEAKHTATTTTKAEGLPVANETAAGIALAVGIGSDDVAASIGGNWQFGGDVTIKADSTATTAVESKASVKGGQLEDEEDVDKQTDDAKQQATDLDGQAIDEEEPADLETPAGSLAVAGAAAVNVAIDKTRAFQEAGSDLAAGGDMSLSAIAKVDSKAKADASTVTLSLPEEPTEPPEEGEEEEEPEIDHNATGVGIAAAGNFAKVTTEATIEGNSSSTAASLKLDAGMAAESGQHLFAAEATSGIGVSKLGVAGSLAINFVRNDSSATIGFGASVDLDQPGGTADPTLTSRNKTKSDAEAKSTVEGRPSTGIGPSAAIDVTRNTSTASLAETAAIAGTVGNYKVEAIGDYDANTESEAETQSEFAPAEEGGDEGGLSISPSLAMTVAVNNTDLFSLAGVAQGAGSRGIGASLDTAFITKSTDAWIAQGTNVDADGNVQVAATSSEDATSLAATAGGAGSTNIVGAAAVYVLDITPQAVLGDDPTDAELPTAPANIHAAGNVLVSATETTELDLITGAAGGAGQSSFGGAANVSTIKKETIALIADGAIVAADASAAVAALSPKTGKFGFSFPNQTFGENEVRPPILNLSQTDSTGDGVNDLTDLSLTRPRLVTPQTTSLRGVAVTATNQEDIATLAVGAAGSGNLAINLTTTVNIVRTTTAARIGDNAQVNVNNQAIAGQQSVLVAAGNDFSHLDVSGSIVGSGSTAIGPAAAVTTVKNDTSASIGANADVKAKRDVTLQAEATEDALLIAASGAASGSVTVAGSLNVFMLKNRTYAFIDNDANVRPKGTSSFRPRTRPTST
jgi:hypothetical protein